MLNGHKRKARVMTTPKSTTACYAVFNITELAETILLLLQPEEIILIQGVCQQWHKIIRTSKVVQEHLFLKPLGPTSHHRLESPFFSLLAISLLSRINVEASWRRMFLTQPPLTEVQVCTKEDWSDVTTIKSATGITLGDVAARGVLYGVKGSADWESYDGYHQLVKLKKARARKEAASELEVHVEDDGDGEDGFWMEDMRW